jgi:hypothetical protein
MTGHETKKIKHEELAKKKRKQVVRTLEWQDDG